MFDFVVSSKPAWARDSVKKRTNQVNKYINNIKEKKALLFRADMVM